MGLVLCFLPSTKNENEEMAVVESISNSPGNLVMFAHIYIFACCTLYNSHIKNNIRIKDLGRLLNKLTGMVLFPLGLIMSNKQDKSFILKFEHGFGSLVPTGSNTEFNVVQFFKIFYEEPFKIIC